MKFNAKAKDCQLIVKAKASMGETIDEKELDRFSRVYLRGFLKPKLVKKNLVEYTGSVGISLYERLKKPTTKRDFLFMLEQIVVSVQKLQANSSLSCLAVFYIENEMYLKADKIAKKFIKVFPDNYQGYHLHILVEVMREHFDEVFAYMDMLPEKFKNHPQRLIDVIEIYKKAGKESELSNLFESDLSFSTIIPQVVLREKISSMQNDEYDDTKEKLIRQLAKDYHDKDAVVSVMILEFSRKNFKKSSQIANAILDNEKENQGFRYYLALYFQIYNLYYLAEKKPSAELQKWIEKAGNWCMNFVDEMGVPAASDVVTSSIQELFDEINSNGNAHK